jgi:hypothetical protein
LRRVGKDDDVEDESAGEGIALPDAPAAAAP